jgi:hypothetical protein
MRLVITPWLPATKCSSDEDTDGSSVRRSPPALSLFVPDGSASSTIDLPDYAICSRSSLALDEHRELAMV